MFKFYFGVIKMSNRSAWALFVVLFLSIIYSGIRFNASKASDYSSAGTIVGGYISENTTWTLEGSPYIVISDVIVEPNVSLTIEPGVVVRFQSGKNLIVDGFLFALGNSTHKIILTSNLENPQPGSWGTIMLRREAQHFMKWAIVEYADKGIHIKFGLVTIRNSIFRWNNIGLYASDAGNIEVRETLIINNTLSGVHTDWFDNSVYLDKVKVLSNGVGLDLGRGHFDMKNSIIARNKGFGIYLPSGFGGFRNIYIYNSTVSENLGYGIYAQGWSWQPTYIIGCTITDNALSGVYREAGQWGVYIYNSTISRNKDSGVRGAVHGVSYNNIFENSPYNFKNEESGDVNATYNWWGTVNETQISKHIYDYYDDYNVGRVIFKPFLSKPATVPDNIAPLIDRPTQRPLPNEVYQSDNVKVAVNVTDYESGVKNVTLWYTTDSGIEWTYTTMFYNESSRLYEGTIPGQLGGTRVKYKIVAFDFNGNMAVEDNLGELYTYQVQALYTLTITTNLGGTTNPEPGTHTYVIGTQIMVTAIPNVGFSFNYWLLDGVKKTENPITIIMDSNHTLEAFFIDNIPPVTVDDYDGLWHNADFTINLMAIDYGSGVSETYYRINSGPVKALSVDGQPLITTEGTNNTLEYWSVDNAGNEEPHKILTGIKLDKTNPLIEEVKRQPEGDVEPGQPVTISANVTDALSGVGNVILSYNINDSPTWTNITITLNATTGLYEATIPGQEANIIVKYKIIAYDNAGNYKIEDNNGQYYTYTVIPEFPSTLILALFILTTSIATILWKTKRKRQLS